MKHITKILISRWVYLLCLSIIGAISFAAIVEFYESGYRGDVQVQYLSRYNNLYTLILYLFLLGIIRSSHFRMVHIKRLYSNFLVSVPIGIAMGNLFLFCAGQIYLSRVEILLIYLILVSGLIIVSLLKCFDDYRFLLNENMKGPDALIESIEDDKYGTLAGPLKRMKMMYKNSLDFNYAIIGNYGSGKSCLINIFKKDIQKERRELIFAQVSCWGFEDVTSIKEYILEKIIAEISEQIDCFSLKNLPSEYLHLIKQIPYKIGDLMGIFHQYKTHDEQLNELDNILQSNGKHLLLIIEDLDRDINSGMTPKSIESLLFKLKSYSSISVIIAIGEGVSFDYAKLTSHTERLNQLTDKSVSDDLILFRTELMNLYKDDYKIVHEVQSLDDYHSADIIRILGIFKKISWGAAVVHSLRTPRLLKRIKEIVQFVWCDLHGEVDFDDLLTIVILRERYGLAYSFLTTNLTRLNHISKTQEIAHQNNKENADLQADVNYFNNIWINIDQQIGADSWCAATLICSLFPNLSALIFKIYNIEITVHNGRQKFFLNSPSDYQQRLIQFLINDDEIKEQKVLRCINDANNSEVYLKELAWNLVEDNRFYIVMEAYSFVLHDVQYFGLIKRLFSIYLKKDQAKTNMNEVSKSILNILHQKTRLEPKQVQDFLIQQINNAFDKSIVFAIQIVSYSGESKYLRDSEFWNLLKDNIFRRIKESDPQLYITAIDHSNPFITIQLLNILWYRNGYKRADELELIGKWLLIALEHSPIVMSPQIACVIFKISNYFERMDDDVDIPRARVTYDEELSNSLFRDKISLVIRSISEIEVDNAQSDKDVISLMKHEARLLLQTKLE